MHQWVCVKHYRAKKPQETRIITLLLEGYCNKILKACQKDSSVPFIPKWSRIAMNFFLTFPCSYKLSYLFHNISASSLISPCFFLDIPLQLVESHYNIIHNSKNINQYSDADPSTLQFFINLISRFHQWNVWNLLKVKLAHWYTLVNSFRVAVGNYWNYWKSKLKHFLKININI